MRRPEDASTAEIYLAALDGVFRAGSVRAAAATAGARAGRRLSM